MRAVSRSAAAKRIAGRAVRLRVVVGFEQRLDFEQGQAFGFGHVLVHEVERVGSEEQEKAKGSRVLVALAKYSAHAFENDKEEKTKKVISPQFTTSLR